MLVLLASCFNAGNCKIEELNQRIKTLEQRIDSLSSAGNAFSIGIHNTNRHNAVSFGAVRQSDRCQAITKKGTQCKRNAKKGSYCWQHGG